MMNETGGIGGSSVARNASRQRTSRPTWTYAAKSKSDLSRTFGSIEWRRRDSRCEVFALEAPVALCTPVASRSVCRVAGGAFDARFGMDLLCVRLTGRSFSVGEPMCIRAFLSEAAMNAR